MLRTATVVSCMYTCRAGVVCAPRRASEHLATCSSRFLVRARGGPGAQVRGSGGRSRLPTQPAGAAKAASLVAYAPY